ncbi:MAG: hypothetical protein ACI9JZ_001068 [Lentimonas sp.]|jgi:hypothetical protein
MKCNLPIRGSFLLLIVFTILLGCARQDASLDQYAMENGNYSSSVEKKHNAVILVVERRSLGEGSKILLSEVEVLRVVKNPLSLGIIPGDIITIGYSSVSGPAMPAGRSVVSLVPYSSSDNVLMLKEVRDLEAQ